MFVEPMYPRRLLAVISLHIPWVLFVSSRYAQHAGLLKDEVTAQMRSATERRIIFYEAFYALTVLLCVINTYLSIALLILLQLNAAIAPRIGGLDRF